MSSLDFYPDTAWHSDTPGNEAVLYKLIILSSQLDLRKMHFPDCQEVEECFKCSTELYNHIVAGTVKLCRLIFCWLFLGPVGGRHANTIPLHWIISLCS